MSICINYNRFINILLLILAVSNDLCLCIHPTVNVNATLNRVGFLPAVATWYGNPTGAGSGNNIILNLFSLNVTNIYENVNLFL